MINVILCGGSGTRLWPVSRTLLPKQFVQIFAGKSLFQKTIERNLHITPRHMIVSNADQYFLAVDQLEEINSSSREFLLEPVGRNTAPAIALALLSLERSEVVLVTPSDHLIQDIAAYEKAVKRAAELAREGFLVTFGIKPQYPETGYGYIESDGEKVLSFTEKPDVNTAQTYIEKGNYYWNSGMFAFQVGVFLDELERHSPEIFKAAQKAYENMKAKRALSDVFMRISKDDMERIPEDSVDFAVLEKSDKVRVVPADIGWSDLGSFDSLHGAFDRDSDGNATAVDNTLPSSASVKKIPIAQESSPGSKGNENIYLNSHNNFIFQSDRIVATIDIDDLIVVDTPDALLISRKGSSQRVKEVVKQLKNRGSELPNIHLTAHRPWGTYTVLEMSERYQIKRIVVKPGKRLSLQKHFHRNEHWVVVSGTASVVVGKSEMIIRANESTYIPMGDVHRLSNPGKIDLVLIEVQVGEYLGEDDIVRIEDDFKR